MKKVNIDKSQLKIIGYISAFTIVSLLSFNYYLINNIEKKIDKYKTIKGPDDSFFKGMEASFSKSSCSGFLTDFDCKLVDAKISISDGNQKKDLFVAEETMLFDVSNTKNTDISFDIGLKNLTLDKESMNSLFGFYDSKNETKEIINEVKKEFLPINGKFKLNVKYLGENKYKSKQYKGNFAWSLENNLINYNSETGFFISEGEGKPLVFSHALVDKEDNIAQPISRVEIKDPRVSRVDFIHTNIQSKKELVHFMYNIYFLLLFDKSDQTKGFINNQYLGVPIERLLSEKELKFFLIERFNDASKSAKDLNDSFSMNYYNGLKEIVIAPKTMKITAENNKNLSIQEIEVINQIQDFIDPTVINEKQFKTKIEVN